MHFTLMLNDRLPLMIRWNISKTIFNITQVTLRSVGKFIDLIKIDIKVIAVYPFFESVDRSIPSYWIRWEGIKWEDQRNGAPSVKGCSHQKRLCNGECDENPGSKMLILFPLWQNLYSPFYSWRQSLRVQDSCSRYRRIQHGENEALSKEEG